MRNFPYLRDISIHALHEESDQNLMAMSNFTY